MYLASVDPADGRLDSLRMLPMQLRQLRPQRASLRDAEWLRGVLDREGRRLGTHVELMADGTIGLEWR
ncbi:hypothetical protein [Corallococcus interemptor]|nr:hypothetical protein [Corallococcus interemptor]